MRVGRALPHRAKRLHASRAPPTALRPKAILLENLEEAYVRRSSISIPNWFVANTSTSSGREGTMWRPASSGADAIAMMRSQIFDALVMDCEQDTLDILNF